MKASLRETLIDIAKKEINNDDPSHDINHALRVLTLGEKIAKKEKADLDIVIPATLFHDLIVYPKNSPKSKHEAHESAEKADMLLREIDLYPKEKLELVNICINEHSFSKQITPTLLESQVVQDADRLEATGAVAIMRTFSSGGQMKIQFYNTEDPFCEKREPEAFLYALDLFYVRLLKVEKSMNTTTAKKLAHERTKFLYVFLEELKRELQGKR